MLVEHDENYKIMMNMKKYICDLVVKSVDHISSKHVLIKLTHEEPLPEMFPGQFVEVSMEGVDGVLLRRPISINFVDRTNNELWLMVAMVGKGTRYLGQVHVGDVVNCVLPLGNSFTMPNKSSERLLLVGGGVGVAPLLYMGAEMKRLGIEPTFLLGARSKGDLLELDLFSHYGRVCITTEDGTEGEKGFITNHSILKKETFDRIVTCGPKPMMMAVARYASQANVECEASLENMMACGLGACLCCVEKTVKGNLCVCKDGPIFNVKQLLWQI